MLKAWLDIPLNIYSSPAAWAYYCLTLSCCCRYAAAGHAPTRRHAATHDGSPGASVLQTQLLMEQSDVAHPELCQRAGEWRAAPSELEEQGMPQTVCAWDVLDGTSVHLCGPA